jgi:hypothetical protein
LKSTYNRSTLVKLSAMPKSYLCLSLFALYCWTVEKSREFLIFLLKNDLDQKWQGGGTGTWK